MKTLLKSQGSNLLDQWLFGIQIFSSNFYSFQKTYNFRICLIQKLTEISSPRKPTASEWTQFFVVYFALYFCLTLTLFDVMCILHSPVNYFLVVWNCSCSKNFLQCQYPILPDSMQNLNKINITVLWVIYLIWMNYWEFFVVTSVLGIRHWY